jgi:signal peptidase I
VREVPPPQGQRGTDTEDPAEAESIETPEPAPAGDGDGRPDVQRRGLFGFLRELPGLILIAFALALLIKTFLIQAFFIPSESMVPTLLVGDRVLVNKLVYDVGEPQRGDIIVFENPRLEEPRRNPLSAFWNWLTEGLGFSSDPTKDFIKRVVAVGGDTIEVARGRVVVNGEEVPEGYVNSAPGTRDRSNHGPTSVPEDHVFVMGDNRPNSQDSRSIGPIPESKIVGKAFILLWPPSRFDWFGDGA